MKGGNGRQMDLSGPGIDVKLKERKKERKIPGSDFGPLQFLCCFIWGFLFNF